MNPSKIKAIVQWLQPVDRKKMQCFMGATNFHREFSHEFARIAVPLDECHSDKKIAWTPEHIQTFQELKDLFLKNIEL
jgi:hypothetical protein